MRTLKAVVLAVVASACSLAATAAPASADSPSPIPCYETLKYGGSLYVDTDTQAAPGDVGPKVGLTDPNPAHCGIPDQVSIYRLNGHDGGDEVVCLRNGKREVFRIAGATGFPFQDALKVGVVVLLILVLVFAAIPGIYAHLKAPPLEVGGAEDPPDL